MRYIYVFKYYKYLLMSAVFHRFQEKTSFEIIQSHLTSHSQIFKKILYSQYVGTGSDLFFTHVSRK